MKSKAFAIGAVLVMCMTAFAGMCMVSDDTDAAAQTYGSSSSPLSYINYKLAFDGQDAGSVWYVSTGSYVTFRAFEDEGGSGEFGSIVVSATSGYGLDNSGCGRLLKAGTVTLNCRWWNGLNGGNFTLTVIGVGDTYYPHTLHYVGNGGSGTQADTVLYSTASGNADVYTSSGSGFTMNGYYVGSWNTQSNGQGTSYAVGAAVSVPKNGSVTLYAQWVLDERNGTAEHPLSSITDTIGYDDRTYYVETGATVDLRGFAEEPEGVYWHDGEGLGLTGYWQYYDFEYDVYGLHGTVNQAGTLVSHWYFVTDPEGNYDKTVNITIVAVNTDVTHTITYAGNGNTGGTMSDTVVTDKTNGNISVSLAACGFTKTGYSFAGWKVGNTVYQPGQSVTVGANATVTATAQWTQNTLTASAGNISGVSGLSYSNQIGASATNGASLSYAVKSCTGGSANINSSGLVTYSAPVVSSTTSYTVTVTVTASFPTGEVLTQDVSFTVNVDPVLSFTNAATSGTLSVKGA